MGAICCPINGGRRRGKCIIGYWRQQGGVMGAWREGWTHPNPKKAAGDSTVPIVRFHYIPSVLCLSFSRPLIKFFPRLSHTKNMDGQQKAYFFFFPGASLFAFSKRINAHARIESNTTAKHRKDTQCKTDEGNDEKEVRVEKKRKKTHCKQWLKRCLCQWEKDMSGPAR